MATDSTVTVTFVGGPCGGKTKQVPAYITAAGSMLCSGAFYTIASGAGGTLTASYVAPQQGATTAGAYSVTAYRDLTNATGSVLPAGLAQAARATRGALQLLGRKGKIR